MLGQIADPTLWQKLGPAGGILALVVTGLWLYREWFMSQRIKEKDEQIARLMESFEKESRNWREAIGKQWRETDAINRSMYQELVSLAERVSTSLTELKTFLEGRMK